MTNRFDKASARLDARLVTYASSLVTYTRPATGQSVQVLAAKGTTPYEINSESGVPVSFESKDFIISVSGLTFDGVATVIPQKEDRIIDGGRVFLVADMGTMKCYQTTVMGLRYRIHTKDVGAAT